MNSWYNPLIMIADELRALFAPFQDPVAAQWQANYLRNQFPCLGVRAPKVRELVKTIPSNDWRSEIWDLWQQPEREFHHAAIFLCLRHKKQATAEDIVLYERLITENFWWDTVDTVAPHLMGPLLQKFPKLVPETKRWLQSPHLWLRRSAIIHQLRAKEKTDTERLFTYCSKLAHEKEFFIRKAIGWALREYGKTNAPAVLEYLETAALSPLSVREAKKHL
jgi:3-methyladenine DNA glycosylase AlkD